MWSPSTYSFHKMVQHLAADSCCPAMMPVDAARISCPSIIGLMRCVYMPSAGDEQFKEEKAVIIKEISSLKPSGGSRGTSPTQARMSPDGGRTSA